MANLTKEQLARIANFRPDILAALLADLNVAHDFPTVANEIVRYARMSGDDETGDGSLENPVRSIERLFQLFPTGATTGTRLVADCSGVDGEVYTDTLPPGYMAPSFLCSGSLDLGIPDTYDEFFKRRGMVTLRADLIPFQSIAAEDTIVTDADCTITANADDHLFKVSLDGAPRSSWATKTTGTGDSFAVTAGVVTLTDSAANFPTTIANNLITIAGSTTPANDGTFMVLQRVSATVIKYVNVAAVAEAFPGTYTYYVCQVKGAIWHASNDGSEDGAGLGDGVVAYGTDVDLYISLSDKGTSFESVAPYQLMQQSAALTGSNPSNGLVGGAFNSHGPTAWAINGIKFTNSTSAGAFGLTLRTQSGLFAVTYCNFSNAVLSQGVSQYRQIWEYNYHKASASVDFSGANLTINSCVFEGITNWNTIPGAGYLAIYDSIMIGFARPFGEQRPLNSGNFQPPTNPSGGGNSLWTKYCRVINGASHGVAMNAGGELAFTSVEGCNGSAVISDMSRAIPTLTAVKGSNNTGYGVLVSNNSVVRRSTATTVTGLLGDYKVGANAAAADAGDGWTALGSDAENDLAAAAMTSQMCRLFTL